MPLTISNASEAGISVLAEQKAEEALSFLNAAQKALDELAGMHWYGDVVDLTDQIDSHKTDLEVHRATLSEWGGNLAFPGETRFEKVAPSLIIAAE